MQDYENAESLREGPKNWWILEHSTESKQGFDEDYFDFVKKFLISQNIKCTQALEQAVSRAYRILKEWLNVETHLLEYGLWSKNTLLRWRGERSWGKRRGRWYRNAFTAAIEDSITRLGERLLLSLLRSNLPTKGLYFNSELQYQTTIFVMRSA